MIYGVIKFGDRRVLVPYLGIRTYNNLSYDYFMLVVENGKHDEFGDPETERQTGALKYLQQVANSFHDSPDLHGIWKPAYWAHPILD